MILRGQLVYLDLKGPECQDEGWGRQIFLDANANLPCNPIEEAAQDLLLRLIHAEGICRDCLQGQSGTQLCWACNMILYLDLCSCIVVNGLQRPSRLGCRRVSHGCKGAAGIPCIDLSCACHMVGRTLKYCWTHAGKCLVDSCWYMLPACRCMWSTQ